MLEELSDVQQQGWRLNSSDEESLSGWVGLSVLRTGEMEGKFRCLLNEWMNGEGMLTGISSGE